MSVTVFQSLQVELGAAAGCELLAEAGGRRWLLSAGGRGWISS